MSFTEHLGSHSGRPQALRLAVAEKSVLVRMDSVQTFRGVDAETVFGMVESGALRWVWDFNNGEGKIRQLRFLALEVFTPEIAQRLTLDQVLKIILGESRESFRGAEIAHRLRLTHPSIHHFYHDGHLGGTLAGKTLHLSRLTLETFLRARLVREPEILTVALAVNSQSETRNPKFV